MIMKVILSFAFLITDNNIVMVIIMTLFFLVSPFLTDILGEKKIMRFQTVCFGLSLEFDLVDHNFDMISNVT